MSSELAPRQFTRGCGGWLGSLVKAESAANCGISRRRAGSRDRCIGGNERFTQRCQPRAAAAASPRRGFKDRLMKPFIEGIQ